MVNKKLRVGFIGLGLMGKPMALNILKAGFPLSVFNRSSKRLAEFKKLAGVTLYDSPAALASNVDVVISCVTGPRDVRQVMLGRKGVAEGDHKNLIAIDMSTIGPSAAIEIGEDLQECGVEFLDGPVTGGTTGAENGTLTIFIGGDEEVYKKVKPVFEAMGKNLQYMGKLGNGQAIKLINNLIVGMTTEALAEGFLLGDVLGLKRHRVSEALENVFGMSPGMRVKMPNMIANTFPPSFSVANIRKDLRIAINESKSQRVRESKGPKVGKKLPGLANAEKLYAKGVKIGMGDDDLSAIIAILSAKD